MNKGKIFIENKEGEKLAGVFHKVNDNKDVVIICHGWPGSKDVKLIKSISEKLEENNINSFRFDFSGQGESEGKFEDTIASKEKEDLNSVIEYFSERNYKISLIGHSFGPLVIIICASENKNIDFLIGVSSKSKTKDSLKNYYKEQQEKIKNNEFFYYNEKRYGTKFKVFPKFFEDLSKYNALELVKKITCPKLFIHGSEDKSLNPKESQDYYKNANNPKELKIIQGADHNFTDKKYLNEMIDYCINWIKRINR